MMNRLGILSAEICQKHSARKHGPYLAGDVAPTACISRKFDGSAFCPNFWIVLATSGRQRSPWLPP